MPSLSSSIFMVVSRSQSNCNIQHIPYLSCKKYTKHIHFGIEMTFYTDSNKWKQVLSYPLLFIGPESDHWQCLSLTDSLTDWLTHWLPFSKLDGYEWYQLLDDVATATESCEKLSKVEKSCVSCPPQLVKVIKLSTAGKSAIWKWWGTFLNQNFLVVDKILINLPTHPTWESYLSPPS